MKQSARKNELVLELVEYQRLLNVKNLYDFPDHSESKNWLAEVGGILRNLNSDDCEEFNGLRKNLYPGIDRRVRIIAANQIDAFVRQKIAEYKRTDFSYLDKRGFKLPGLKILSWITSKIEVIITAVVIALATTFALIYFKLN